jgi:hypothetical protein
MPEIQQANAIRTRVWMGGDFFFRDAVPIQIAETRFEGMTRTANLGLRVDRNWTGPLFPNIRNRFDITLPWEDLREPGLLERIDILAQTGQPFGLGLWKQVYDVFDGDGETTDFVLQRQQLLERVTPPVEFEDYPTRVVVYDRPYAEPGASPTELTVVQKTNADIDTGDPGAGEVWVESDGHSEGSNRVARMRLGTAPPDALDCVVAIYLPFIWVVIKAQPPRSYAQALVEPRALQLAEFG